MNQHSELLQTQLPYISRVEFFGSPNFTQTQISRAEELERLFLDLAQTIAKYGSNTGLVDSAVMDLRVALYKAKLSFGVDANVVIPEEENNVQTD